MSIVSMNKGVRLESKVEHGPPLDIYTFGIPVHTYGDDALNGGVLTPDNTFVSFVPEQANRVYVMKAAQQRDLYNREEVSNYRKHLGGKGLPVRDTVGWSVKYDLGRAWAAHDVTEVEGKKGSLFFSDVDYNFKHAFSGFLHGVSAENSQLYGALHETGHSVKNASNKLFRAIYGFFPYAAERFVERNVFEYATEMAEKTEGKERQKWEEIAKIAKNRYERVVENYRPRKAGWRKDRNENENPEQDNLEERIEEAENAEEGEAEPEEDGEAVEGE